jgi:hypothetical protein
MATAIISRRTTTTIDKMRKPLGLHSETYSIKGTKSSPIATKNSNTKPVAHRLPAAEGKV